MKFFFILILLVSCTSVSQKSLFSGFTPVTSTGSADAGSLHYQNGEQHIFYSLIMSDLDSSEAKRLFQNRVNYLKSLYQNDKDPYFGKTSRNDECLKGIDLEKKMMTNKSSEWVSFKLPSTDNFVLGQCNPRLESYEAQISFIYCKKGKKFYELKHFFPKETQSLMKVKPEDICEI